MSMMAQQRNKAPVKQPSLVMASGDKYPKVFVNDNKCAVNQIQMHYYPENGKIQPEARAELKFTFVDKCEDHQEASLYFRTFTEAEKIKDAILEDRRVTRFNIILKEGQPVSFRMDYR